MTLWSALPMGFVMIAGPQIVTAIMLATSRDAKRNSAAFLAGVATAVTIGTTVFFVIAQGVQSDDADESSGGSNGLTIASIILLLVLAALAYRNRHDTEPPKWMVRLQGASAAFAFRIGLLLFLVMPTDVITMFTVSNLLAREGSPWWHTLLFVALTVFLVGIPALMLTVMGSRAEVTLPKMRTWMTTNAWIVNEAVIALFLVMSVNSLISD